MAIWSNDAVPVEAACETNIGSPHEIGSAAGRSPLTRQIQCVITDVTYAMKRVECDPVKIGRVDAGERRAHSRRARSQGRHDGAERARLRRSRPAPATTPGRPDRVLRTRPRGPAHAGP